MSKVQAHDMRNLVLTKEQLLSLLPNNSTVLINLSALVFKNDNGQTVEYSENVIPKDLLGLITLSEALAKATRHRVVPQVKFEFTRIVPAVAVETGDSQDSHVLYCDCY